MKKNGHYVVWLLLLLMNYSFGQFRPEHGCSKPTAAKSFNCQTLSQIKNHTKWDIKATTPAHRGLWAAAGTNSPHAENSIQAFGAAKRVGFRTIEIDLVRGQESIFRTTKFWVTHDYKMKRLIRNAGEFDNISSKSNSKLRKAKLNNSASNGSFSKLLSLTAVLDWVKNNNMVVYLDLKESQGSGDKTVNFQKELKQVYNIVAKKKALNHVIFKIPRNRSYKRTNLVRKLSQEQWKKMLMMPVIVEGDYGTPKQISDYIDDIQGRYGHSIVGYETNMKNNKSVFVEDFTKKFIDDKFNITERGFQGIGQYVNDIYKLRTGLFITEPLPPTEKFARVFDRFGNARPIPLEDHTRDYIEMKNAVGAYLWDRMIITTDKPQRSRFPNAETNNKYRNAKGFPLGPNKIGKGRETNKYKEDSNLNDLNALEDDKLAQEVTFFPNPIDDVVTISATNMVEADRVVFYNFSGLSVLERNIEGGISANVTLRGLSAELSPGVYILKAYSKTGAELIAKKVIKN